VSGIGLNRRKDGNRKGFTLTELLVVLAIVGITSAIAAPGVSAWIQNYRAKTAARQLMTDLAFARMTAVAQGSCTVTMYILTNSYTITDVNGNTIGIPRQLGVQLIGGASNEPNPYYAPGVTLGWTPVTAQTQLAITFNPLGQPTPFPTTYTATITQGAVAQWKVTVSPTGGIAISGGAQFAL
jgi:prepilin-type N-terminal cleavage/methylation domain-containing protein